MKYYIINIEYETKNISTVWKNEVSSYRHTSSVKERDGQQYAANNYMFNITHYPRTTKECFVTKTHPVLVFDFIERDFIKIQESFKEYDIKKAAILNEEISFTKYWIRLVNLDFKEVDTEKYNMFIPDLLYFREFEE